MRKHTVPEIVRQLLGSWRSRLRHPELVGLTKRIKPLFQTLHAVAQSRNNCALIVNAGLLKAGKSMLFRYLSGMHERFASGAARCTIKTETCRVVLGAHEADFADTPGIDANRSDQAEAETALSEAHLVVFVHSMSQGELQMQEIEFLRRLKNHLASTGLNESTIIPVLTRSDEVNGETDQQQLMQRIREQWNNAFDESSPDWLCTSAPRFVKGLETGNPRWTELSGIPSLRACLEQRVAILHDQLPHLARARATRTIDEILRSLKTEEQARVRQVIIEKRRIQEENRRCRQRLDELLESIERGRDNF